MVESGNQKITGGAQKCMAFLQLAQGLSFARIIGIATAVGMEQREVCLFALTQNLEFSLPDLSLLRGRL